MNDASEVTHGLHVASKAINARMETAACTTAQREALAKLLDYKEKVAEGTLNEPPLSLYSVSFCAESNHLPQWRGYRDAGGGLALEFDLMPLLHTLNCVAYPRRVIYDGAAHPMGRSRHHSIPNF